ncbi:hypothetical protein FRC03_003566 [Tulasnella sp. 419]|nr:hypothetical protein FRC02_002969 [Tulasnella sp. 418]KAG8942174.1 hypothetical protein FRC03_003566 [Tulasnella sp. 419]
MVATRTRKQDSGNASTQSSESARSKKKADVNSSAMKQTKAAAATKRKKPAIQDGQLESEPTMPGPLHTNTNTHESRATSLGLDQDPLAARIELLEKRLEAKQEARRVAEARGSKYKKLALKEREARQPAKNPGNDAEASQGAKAIPRPQGKDKRTKI